MISEWINTEQIVYQDIFSQANGITLSKFEGHEGLKNIDLAIISHSQAFIAPILEKLVESAGITFQPRFAFLGNLRRQNIEYLSAAINDLKDFNIPLISFGLDDEQLDLWLGNEHTVGHTLIVHSGEGIGDMLMNEDFDYSLLGLQKHLISLQAKDWMDASSKFTTNLGELNHDISTCEPSVRQADHIFIDLSCLKYADASDQKRKGISGMSSEEVCKIMHYAGFNLRLKSIQFSGISEDPLSDMGIDLYRQLIWYFLHARASALQNVTDKPELLEFVIESEGDLSSSLTFIKNTYDQTWWVNLNDRSEDKRLLPCSEEDFNALKSDKITKRIFHYLSNY